MRNLFKNLQNDSKKLDLYFFTIVMIAVSLLVLIAHGIAIYNYLGGRS